jgi:hypothetical protein
MHTGDYFVWNCCAVCGKNDLQDVADPLALDLSTTQRKGKRKASICRANKCGRYDSEKDTCGVLTDRGKRGAIQWLYLHPNANCPNDPPMWTNEDDTVGAGKDKQERLGDALERTVEDRPTK